MHHDTPLISIVSLGFALAYLFGMLANKLRLSPLIGYLVAGVLLGPQIPFFYNADLKLANELSELGVILLMFGVGMHFSLKDLNEVRNVAVTGALAQIAGTILLTIWVGHILGYGWFPSAIFGLCLSVASTVVLLRALEDHGIQETPRGKIAIGWLIVEDLITVVVLVVMPSLQFMASDEPFVFSDFLLTLLWTAVKFFLFVAVMFGIARKVIPWIISRSAATGSRELFLLSVLAIGMGIAYLSVNVFDISFALGAFFAGMILHETELAHRADEATLPLRDAFSVLFFVSVGMLFNPWIILTAPALVVITTLLIIAGKSVIAYFIVRFLGKPNRTAYTIAISLAQIGEFSFILAGLAVTYGYLDDLQRDVILAGAITSIVVNPFLFRAMEWWIHRYDQNVRRNLTRLAQQGIYYADAHKDARAKRNFWRRLYGLVWTDNQIRLTVWARETYTEVLYFLGKQEQARAVEENTHKYLAKRFGVEGDIAGLDFDRKHKVVTDQAEIEKVLAEQAEQQVAEAGAEQAHADVEPALATQAQATPDPVDAQATQTAIQAHPEAGQDSDSVNSEASDEVISGAASALPLAEEDVETIIESSGTYRSSHLPMQGHHIVVGYGIVGKQLVNNFRLANMSVLVLTNSVKEIYELNAAGILCAYGNFKEAQTWQQVWLEQALGIVFTTDAPYEIGYAVDMIYDEHRSLYKRANFHVTAVAMQDDVIDFLHDHHVDNVISLKSTIAGMLFKSTLLALEHDHHDDAEIEQAVASGKEQAATALHPKNFISHVHVNGTVGESHQADKPSSSQTADLVQAANSQQAQNRLAQGQDAIEANSLAKTNAVKPAPQPRIGVSDAESRLRESISNRNRTSRGDYVKRRQ